MWALMLEQVVEKDARLTDYTVQEPASAQSR
jgi:hypothetical protein